MTTQQASSELYNQIVLCHQNKPTDFKLYEKSFDIKKLELGNLTHLEIKNKLDEWKIKKTNNNIERFKSWMENEYRIFMWLMISLLDLGHNPDQFTNTQWNQIGSLFTKEGKVCKYFYFCCKKSLSTGWTQQEDQIVLECMKESEQGKKWTQVGILLFTLSGEDKIHKPKAIRQRWFSRLNPAIKKSRWSNDDDIKLFEMIKMYGKKWSKIAKQFGDRNQHTIKNRYHQVILRKIKKQKMGSHQDNQKKLVESVLDNLTDHKNKDITQDKQPITQKQQNTEQYPQTDKSQNKYNQAYPLQEFKPLKFMPIVLHKPNFQV